MGHYAIHGFGLFLEPDAAEEFAKKFSKDFDGTDEEALDTFEVFQTFDCVSMVDDDYDTCIINPLVRQSAIPFDYENTHGGAILISQKQGKIFDDAPLSTVDDFHKGASYKNPQEMADEFKNEYGKYLPEDYDILKHLCSFTYVYFAD